jgi:endoglucanase
VQQVSSWSQTPIPISNISNTNPGVLTTSIPHGLQNGELVRLWFTGHAGYDAMWRLNARTVRVKNKTATTFEMQEFEVANAWTDFDLRNPSPGYPGYGTYGRWPHGLLYKTVAINRSGTYVYGLDYSRWVASNPGTYRIRIPGLGVSDPIQVGESAWYMAASGSAQGEYHHRSGIELDGRFGYARPSCFNGNAIKIYESNLPYVASDLGGGPIPTQAGAAPPHIRTSTTTFGGSWADAGDWVQRVAGVSGACYNFCDLTELVPLAASSTNFNLPKSSTLLDPILYRGTDSLPDVVHQAIFGLDTYRRTQNEAGKTFGYGAVYGGLGMTTGTGVTPLEPSHLFRGISFTYAPDHFSTFAFAGAAAKVATTLAAYGFTSLSEVWKQSAIDAWNWANPIYLDASGEFDAYYIGLLQLKSNAGWNDAAYASFKSNVHNLSSDFRARSFASGCLYRLTGDGTYKSTFEKHWGPPNGFEMVGEQVLGAWEYQKRVGANAAISADIRRRLVERADVSLVAYSQGHVAYRSIQFLNGSPFNWGSCGTDIGDTSGALVRAHFISRNPKFIATLQSGLAFLYGANQMGMSFTAGVGVRWPQTLFNQDSLAMGVPTPTGISGYGFWILGCQAQAAIFQFGSGFFNWIINYPDSRYTSDFEFERTEEPNNFALPIYEALHESHYVLNQMERSIQQTVLPLQFSALYLHGWDGNKEK